MVKSCFFVQLSTSETFDADDYPAQAEAMVSVLRDVFESGETMTMLTKKELTACHTALDVSQLSGSLTGRALVEIESAEKVNLDKTKMSSLFKKSAPWKVKVEKRCIDDQAFLEQPLQNTEGPEGFLQ